MSELLAAALAPGADTDALLLRIEPALRPEGLARLLVDLPPARPGPATVPSPPHPKDFPAPPLHARRSATT